MDWKFCEDLRRSKVNSWIWHHFFGFFFMDFIIPKFWCRISNEELSFPGWWKRRWLPMEKLCSIEERFSGCLHGWNGNFHCNELLSELYVAMMNNDVCGTGIHLNESSLPISVNFLETIFSAQLFQNKMPIAGRVWEDNCSRRKKEELGWSWR